MSSPKRLEILEMLAQGEKTVEALSTELMADVKLTSVHLRALKEARLVTARREGKFMVYRLTGSDVGGLWMQMRQVAEERLLELRMALQDMVAYCRGPFCLISEETHKPLHTRGYRVTKLLDGVSEWQVAGLPLAHP